MFLHSSDMTYYLIMFQTEGLHRYYGVSIRLNKYNFPPKKNVLGNFFGPSLHPLQKMIIKQCRLSSGIQCSIQYQIDNFLRRKLFASQHVNDFEIRFFESIFVKNTFICLHVCILYTYLCSSCLCRHMLLKHTQENNEMEQHIKELCTNSLLN